jgi:hypothetical protein
MYLFLEEIQLKLILRHMSVFIEILFKSLIHFLNDILVNGAVREFIGGVKHLNK